MANHFITMASKSLLTGKIPKKMLYLPFRILRTPLLVCVSLLYVHVPGSKAQEN